MAAVVEYAVSPPALRDTRSNQELFTSLHKEIVELGPRGPLIVLGVFFSSSLTLLARGTHWLYLRIRGYA